VIHDGNGAVSKEPNDKARRGSDTESGLGRMWYLQRISCAFRARSSFLDLWTQFEYRLSHLWKGLFGIVAGVYEERLPVLLGRIRRNE
jgi:hypothetical protein